MRTGLMVVAASVLAVMGLNAQSVISAHSGVLHYYEGDVTIEGSAPHQRAGTFADVKEKQVLETQVGRAEVLLTPGVFLRLGENTQVRMLSNKLTDTRVEFLKGSAIVDFVEVAKDNMVTVNYQDYKVTFLRKGIYRFDSEPAEVKVYTGAVTVSRGGNSVTAKDGRAVPFTPALVSDKFDNRNGDALYRWAKRRSEYIAVANLSAARQAGSSFNAGGSSGVGGWYYNPYYSMFTFIPNRGYMCDPFSTFMSPYSLFSPMAGSLGCYYSPMSAWNYFSRPTYYSNYGGGGRSSGLNTSAYNSSGYYPTSIGTSSTLSTYSSSPSSYSSAPSASPSPVSISSPSTGFSGGGMSGGGGGGGGASHGGGSAGGHGR